MKHVLAFILLFKINLIASITYPDFTISMMRGHDKLQNYNEIFTYYQLVHNCTTLKNIEIFRNVYANSVMRVSEEISNENRIPKIVHQIWLGSPVPEKFHKWMSTWMNWNGWEYKLWTDQEAKNFLLFNQDLYDESTNYGEKSDILRLEILIRFGGVYVDVDFECLNPKVFEELNQSYDFYAGFEPVEHGMVEGIFKTCNALIGAAPNHPIIRELMFNLKANWMLNKDQTAVQKSGPNFFTKTLVNYETRQLCPIHRDKVRNIYLPCTFFYPFSEPEIRMVKDREELLSKVYPETAAIHHWTGSWFIPGGK